MKTKLPAFTMIEVTVAMILSGICIAIAFNVFQMSSQFFKKQQDGNNYVNELQAFRFLFQRDVLRNANVIVGNSNVLIEQKDEAVIAYNIEDGYIIRNKMDHIDTFHLSASNLQSELLVIDGHTYSLTSTIILDVLCEKRTVPITFHLHYDPAFLFANRNNETL